MKRFFNIFLAIDSFDFSFFLIHFLRAFHL